MRSALRSVGLCCLALVLGVGGLPTRASAQTQEASQAPRSLRVLMVQGLEVTIDLGAQDRLQPGDRVRFEPLGHPALDALVTAVRDREAIVTLPAPDATIQVGVGGQVWPTGPLPPSPADEVVDGREPSPGEIRWEEDPDIWQEGMPLLGRAEVRQPQERPAHWSGQFTLGSRWFESSGPNQREDQQTWARLGVRGNNPFGRGGVLRAQVDGQISSLEGATGLGGTLEDSDDHVRLLQASYAWGGTRFQSRRYEVGRFYSPFFSELGLIDGVETSQRLASGARIGARVGFLPGFDVDLPFEDNFAIAAYWDRPLTEDARTYVGAAVQKTWFDGKEDRDWVLFKGRLEEANWTVEGAVEADLYQDEPVEPTSGTEVTHARLRVEHEWENRGTLAVYATDDRWPNTRRGLPVLSDPDFLISARIQREGLDGVWRWGDDRLWRGRLERWEDEDSDGSLGELGLEGAWPQSASADWHVRGYWNETDLADIAALRVGSGMQTTKGRFDLSAELGRFELLDTAGEVVADSKGVVRGSWSTAFASRWQAFLQGAVYFGGDEDAYSVAFTLTRSF